MTTINLDNEPTTDPQLVAASCAGDHQAFGRLVRRYQGMISGLIYAYCGDLHRSEDLAQETFISAWKNLSDLREREKLVPWLCQMARRRAVDDLRSAAREINNLARLGQAHIRSEMPSPAQEALSAEERDLLWRILSELPQPYRETMVLYYRHEQSTQAVAEAMETTPTAVRERLTRGRQMLREQVAAALEINLVRSAPAPSFAQVVVAALPSAISPALKTAGLGAAAKGSAVTTGGMLTTLLGPLTAVAAGAMALRDGLRNARSAQERRVIIRFGILLGLLIVAGMAALSALPAISRKLHVPANLFGVELSAMWLIYTLAIVAVCLGVRRRLSVLRSSAQQNQPTASGTCAKKMPLWIIVGATVGCTAWMIDMAWSAHDMLGVIIVSVTTVILIAAATWGFRRWPNARGGSRFAAVYVLVIGLITIPMVDWRFYAWLAAQRGMTVAEIHQQLPLWSLNLLIITLFACAELMVLASTPIASNTRPSPQK
jgi:RNA polymerase sigma factor (sigma-70 family)